MEEDLHRLRRMDYTTPSLLLPHLVHLQLPLVLVLVLLRQCSLLKPFLLIGICRPLPPWQLRSSLRLRRLLLGMKQLELAMAQRRPLPRHEKEPKEKRTSLAFYWK